MKTLSAFNQTAIDNPNAAPIRLVKIDFNGLITYFCDRTFGDAGSEYEFDGQIYEPLVLSWGDIDFGEVGQLKDIGTPSDFSFRVDNTVPIAGFSSFTSIFSIYPPIFGTVTVYEFYEGGSAAGDLITRFKGTIEDIDMELEYVNVNCTSIEVSLIHKFPVTICDEDTYPGADPDDWGKMLPIAYGSCKRVPFLSIDAGAMSTLTEDMGDGALSEFEGSDITKFPQGGGTIQIDLEEFTYSYIDGNTFKGVARAQNGTTAVEHSAGATIAEIQSEYHYIIGNAVKSIDAVYVVNRSSDENLLQPASLYTAYTGQTGDEHASYPGKAVIIFNTLPIIGMQINIEAVDTIDVNDTTDVQDTIDVLNNNHAHGGDKYGIWHTEYGYNVTGYAPDPSNAFDGSMGTYCQIYHGQTTIKGQKLRAEELGSMPKYYRICALVGFCDGGAAIEFSWSGSTVQGGYGVTGLLQGGWGVASWTNWSQIQALQFTVKNRAGSGVPGVVQVQDVWVEFQQDDVVPSPSDAEKDGDAIKIGDVQKIGTVELVGNSVADTVIGGIVSADLQGWPANDSGDYGDTASLIQRPDYLFKHFLVTYCGRTIATDIDATSYSASGALYETDNVTLAVVLLEKPDVRELLAEMARQCRSYEFWESGVHVLKRIPTVSTTDKVIEGGRIDIDSVKVRYTPRDELINKYSVNFDKHWVGDYGDGSGRLVQHWAPAIGTGGRKTSILMSASGVFRGIITVNSTPSEAIYGSLEGEPLNLKFVNNSTQALRLANWQLDETSFPRLIIEFTGGDYFADLERCDIIEFTFDSGDELDKRLLGLVLADSDQFRIMHMKRMENGKFFIQCYIDVTSTSNTGTFYPSAIGDDGYTQTTNFYNTTIANMMGNYTGSVFTSTTTTTTTA